MTTYSNDDKENLSIIYGSKHLWKIVKKKLSQLNFLKHQESKGCSKKVGFLLFKMGWFKIKADTNLGPQSYMYLSNTAFTLKLKLS